MPDPYHPERDPNYDVPDYPDYIYDPEPYRDVGDPWIPPGAPNDPWQQPGQ